VIWLDGTGASSLPLPDRGLDFGDGLFETLLLKGREPLFLPLHLQRLQRGLQRLRFPDCLESARDQILLAAAQPGAAAPLWSTLRLTITRGAGPRGYAPPEKAVPRLVAITAPLHRDCTVMAPPARLGTAQIRWSLQPRLAGIKHLNRLDQVLAAAEARDAEVDEMIMLDQAGRVISVSSGNLFLVFGRRIVTPLIEDCGIAGTRRQLVISEWAPALGYEVSAEAVDQQQLAAADEVFYSNSLLGLRPVGALASRRWRQHSVCARLHSAYLEELR
jgi:4-amino-4-deoxychorismate lyase